MSVVGSAQLISRRKRVDLGATMYTDTYKVISDSASDTATTIFAALPQLYTQHSDNLYAYCHDVDAVLWEENKPLVWRGTCQFTTARPGVQFVANPLNETPDVYFDGVRQETIIEEDKDGAPVRNTAGDRFDPESTRLIPARIIRVERNEATFDDATKSAYEDSVNSAQITIAGRVIAARTGYIGAIRGSPQRRNGTNYYRVIYEIEINRLTWDLKRLSMGRREKSGGELVWILDENSRPVAEPQKLNSAGAAYSATDQTDNTKYAFVTKRVIREVAWAGLNLPTTE